MNILQSIYTAFTDYGHHNSHKTKEYIELVETYSQTLDRLQDSLSDEQKTVFFEAEAQRNLIAADDEEAMFQFGFRLGAKVMLEILQA